MTHQPWCDDPTHETVTTVCVSPAIRAADAAVWLSAAPGDTPVVVLDAWPGTCLTLADVDRVTAALHAAAGQTVGGR